MIALIVIGCILLFFALLLSLKATVSIVYNGEVELYLKVLFIRIKLLPRSQRKKGPRSMSIRRANKIKEKLRKKAEKKRLKALEKQERKQQKKDAKAKGKTEKKSVSEILDIIHDVTDIVKSVTKTFFGHLKVKVTRLNIKIATGDAATTAIAYGAVCDALLHLFAILERLDGVSLPQRRNVSVSADYLSEESEFDIKLSFSLRVWHVLHVGIVALIKLVGYLLKKKEKDENKQHII